MSEETLDNFLKILKEDTTKLPDEDWQKYYTRVIKPIIDELNKMDKQFDIRGSSGYLIGFKTGYYLLQARLRAIASSIMTKPSMLNTHGLRKTYHEDKIKEEITMYIAKHLEIPMQIYE